MKTYAIALLDNDVGENFIHLVQANNPLDAIKTLVRDEYYLDSCNTPDDTDAWIDSFKDVEHARSELSDAEMEVSEPVDVSCPKPSSMPAPFTIDMCCIKTYFVNEVDGPGYFVAYLNCVNESTCSATADTEEGAIAQFKLVYQEVYNELQSKSA